MISENVKNATIVWREEDGSVVVIRRYRGGISIEQLGHDVYIDDSVFNEFIKAIKKAFNIKPDQLE